MSRLDELIQEKCSNGVEYVPLWSVTIWDKKFSSVDRKKQPKVKDYPYLLASDLFALQVDNGNVFLLSTGEQTGWTTEELAGENLREGEVVTIPWGKSRAVTDCIKYYKGKFVTADNRIMTSNDAEKLNNKYLYYWIMSQGKTIDTFYRGSGIKHPDMAKVLDMEIPIPPLEIQREIVRILDNFTNLTAELTAELTARKAQYGFYREKLLDKTKISATMTKVADLGKWSGGKTPSMAEKKYWESGTIPWVSSKDVKQPILSDTIDHITNAAVDEASMTVYPAGSVAIVTRSGILRHTFPVTYIPFETTVNQDIKILVTKEGISSRYVSHALQAYGENIRRTTKKQGGTVDSLDFQKVLAYKIPVPPLDVQNRIVNVLDNFEKICSDLNIGLPAEIEARQKQYEYYRDKLLTFAENGNTILSRAEQSRAEQSRAEQSRAEQSRAEQSRALIKLMQYVFGYAVVTLEDIAENCDSMRKPVTSGKREAGEYPYYGASGIVDYVKDYIFDGDYLLVSEDGANLLARSTPIAFSISGKNWVNNHAHVLKFDRYETRRFVEFYLNSIDLAPYISGGAQPKLNQKNLNRIEIPLPSQERQKYIVEILDRFDSICNDLTSGLPAEIEARQKQYEYYRDKLLSFKERL